MIKFFVGMVVGIIFAFALLALLDAGDDDHGRRR